jgi:hypothetical protein
MDNGYAHISNLEIPAGYTYLMQFISHDMTYNTANPTLTLSSIYGASLKKTNTVFDEKDQGLFKLGKFFEKQNIHDFIRDSYNNSNIVDKRNEMTVMLMQINLLFMHFHNKIYSDLKGSWNERFLRAREIVESSYRTIIINDILPRILSHDEIIKIKNGFKQWRDYNVRDEFLQFHSAVFRFGHAMVQPSYRLNKSYQAPISRKFNDRFKNDLIGNIPLEDKLIIDWSHFFKFKNTMTIQYASKINTKLCRPLFNLFQKSELNPLFSSIAYRTLFINYKLELPNAIDILNYYSIDSVLNDNHFVDLGYKIKDVPLWIYILKEAEVEMQGTKLGVLGRVLTARTFSHLLSPFNLDNEVKLSTAFFKKKQIDITDIIKFTYGEHG